MLDGSGRSFPGSRGQFSCPGAASGSVAQKRGSGHEIASAGRALLAFGGAAEEGSNRGGGSPPSTSGGPRGTDAAGIAHRRVTAARGSEGHSGRLQEAKTNVKSPRFRTRSPASKHSAFRSASIS